jgi:geranylgeranylglycerol-phosphate geranylgeranyltransferase
MKSMYPLSSYKFWKAYFIQCRPYLLFVSGIAGLAGISMLGEFSFSNLKLWLSFIPLFLGYGFGQALTDTWQTDTDSLSAPDRPLSKGIISKKTVRIVSLLGLIGCSGLLVYLNYLNIIFGILSIVGLSTYTSVKKNYWFAGPFYNAWIVALLPIMGYLSITSLGLVSLSNSSLLLVCLVSFFSYTNFVLMGYLKDISADKATNYKTFPVLFGWNATVYVSDCIGIISMVLVLTLVSSRLSLIFAILAGILTLIGQLYAHTTKVKDENNAHFPIVMTVRSFIFWHISIVLEYQSGLLYGVLLFYLFFEIFLSLRSEKKQV